jgi:hypothetical protein
MVWTRYLRFVYKITNNRAKQKVLGDLITGGFAFAKYQFFSLTEPKPMMCPCRAGSYKSLFPCNYFIRRIASFGNSPLSRSAWSALVSLVMATCVIDLRIHNKHWSAKLSYPSTPIMMWSKIRIPSNSLASSFCCNQHSFSSLTYFFLPTNWRYGSRRRLAHSICKLRGNIPDRWPLDTTSFL